MDEETHDVGPVTVGEIMNVEPVESAEPVPAENDDSQRVDPNAGQRLLTAPRAKRLGHRLAAEIITDAISGRKHCFQSWFEGLSDSNRSAVLSALFGIKDNHETMSL